MAASAFHLFPNLPCEIRVKIWEFAIRPSGAGLKGGLHYFFILKKKIGEIPKEYLDEIPDGLSVLDAVFLKKKKPVNENEARGDLPGSLVEIFEDLHLQSREDRSPSVYKVAVSRFGGANDNSPWAVGNRSAYLWDAAVASDSGSDEEEEVQSWHTCNYQDLSGILTAAQGSTARGGQILAVRCPSASRSILLDTQKLEATDRLLRLITAGTAASGSLTAAFRIRPYLRPSIADTDRSIFYDCDQVYVETKYGQACIYKEQGSNQTAEWFFDHLQVIMDEKSGGYMSDTDGAFDYWGRYSKHCGILTCLDFKEWSLLQAGLQE
ncbi:hypothetical protein QBC46DRAFT_408867 [Diplogelasinospora grovesii]|uniref:2EXR domain-containing protein n=1 Tax=Diplogelasinospora grovesii TaxID=303347 RepID=A0AAN6N7E3_9PEZI|nr:hypothetical protein QBC46DRAFT_408867 [Diplogelasinospora grovesii]